MSESPTDVIRSVCVLVEERRDGQWRCQVTGENVGMTKPPNPEWKPRRLFVREFHRALEQLNGLVFRGGIRSL